MTFRVFAQRTLFVVLIFLLLAALWFFRDTLLLAFLAVVVAVGISIPAGWLLRRGLPQILANTVSAVVTGLLLLFLLLWLVPTVALSLGTVLSGLPQGLENLASFYSGLLERNDVLVRLLPPLDLDAGDVSEAEVRQLLEEIVNAGLPILVSGGSFAFSLLANLVLASS